MNDSLLNSEERKKRMPLLINPKLLGVSVEPNAGYGSAGYDVIGSIGNLGFGFFRNDMEALIKIYNGTLQYYSSQENDPDMDHLELAKNEKNGIDIIYFDNVNHEGDCWISLDGKHFTELVYPLIMDKDGEFKRFLYSLEQFLELVR